MTPYYCSGSCPPDYSPTPKPTKEQVEDDRVIAYFTSLGYEVDWDYNTRLRESWHEISDINGLICQVDRGVPLVDIVEDMTAMAGGTQVGTSKTDYKISGPDGPRLKRLFNKVAKKGKSK